ncbi:MAG: AbrB/MazE/SpoVT family DNA-binding domain-containing protein, partial [Coleofasciculus sp. C2-GNP5-27]
MEIKLRKVGNSIGTTFPKEILDKFDLREGDTLTLVVMEDGIKLMA